MGRGRKNKKKHHDNLRQTSSRVGLRTRVVKGPTPLKPERGSCAKGNPLREVSSSSPSQRETRITRPPSPRGRHHACLDMRLGSSPRGCWGTTLSPSFRSCALTISPRRGLFGLPSVQGQLMAWQTVSRKGGGKGWNQAMESQLLQSMTAMQNSISQLAQSMSSVSPGEQGTRKGQTPQRAGQGHFIFPRGKETPEPQTCRRTCDAHD